MSSPPFPRGRSSRSLRWALIGLLLLIALGYAGRLAYGGDERSPRAAAGQASSTVGDVSTPLAEGVDFATLASRSTRNVGNNNAVIAIGDALGFGAHGRRSYALETESPSTVTVSLPAPPGDRAPELLAQALRDRAVLMLAALPALDRVVWEVSGVDQARGMMNRAGANELAGRDVAAASGDESQLRAIAERLAVKAPTAAAAPRATSP